MKKLSELSADPRFEDAPLFAAQVLGHLDLSDDQVADLSNQDVKVIEADCLDEMITFLKNAERLIVCGDYDCDGVCSTAIALMTAKELGVQETGFYIPNRLKEGYGVSIPTLDRAYNRGYTDVLIIDNGVKAQEEILFAKSLGMNVAVVDHHLIEEPVNADVFVHPDLLDKFGSTMCATGLMAIIAEKAGVLTDRMLAYAAVATIADVMPLWGKNRELVRRGIQVMNQQPMLALDLLAKRTRDMKYTSQIIAFQIVPKINAVGRLADYININTMVEYLLAEDEKLITEYAKQVHTWNDFRKEKGKEIKAVSDRLIDDNGIQIISHPGFHEGLLGIVANQIAQSINRPAIVLTEYEDSYKGSARSTTVSLSDLFAQIDRDYFEAMGGHDFAFGMTIKKKHYEKFYQEVKQVYKTLPSVKKETNAILADIPITKEMLMTLAVYEPFGAGFAIPSFAVELPEDFRVISLNGHGYRLIFKDFWLKDAVLFNTNVSQNELLSLKEIIGRMDIHPRYGVAFTIEEFK